MCKHGVSKLCHKPLQASWDMFHFCNVKSKHSANMSTDYMWCRSTFKEKHFLFSNIQKTEDCKS